MKSFRIIILIILIAVLGLVIYPFIEINQNNRIIKFSYSDDASEFENNDCYSESYFYNEERDISVYDFHFKKFLFFHMIILDYVDGNACKNEYMLEEKYIYDFLNNAEIKYNDNNIDLGKLIEGKTAIVSNTKYYGNDYKNSISYILNGRHEELYIFYVEDLLIIQVGLPDEGPKYIAYK